MTLNIRKCLWAQNELKFLGMVLSQDGVRPDPNRVEGIRLVPTPVNKKYVQSFLGMMNFYRTLIPNFADLALRLYELTRDNVKFIWSTKQTEAFNQLKEALIAATLINYADFTRPFAIRTDAQCSWCKTRRKDPSADEKSCGRGSPSTT